MLNEKCKMVLFSIFIRKPVKIEYYKNLCKFSPSGGQRIALGFIFTFAFSCYIMKCGSEHETISQANAFLQRTKLLVFDIF